MGQLHPEAKAKIKAVLEALSLDERKLFVEVYRIEQRHLHNKSFGAHGDLLKKLKEIIR
jgi:hypothetical protein